MRSKKIVAAAVIACCVASQAQLLEKPKKYEGSFVPVTKLESKDRMDPEVRKFVDAQKAKKSVRKQGVKSDILGRKGTNKSASVKDSVVYAVDEASTAKMKVLVGRVHQYTPTGMQGYRDDVRYDEKTKKVIYSINGKEMSKAEYEKKTAEWENKYEQKKPNRTAPVVKYLTAKQIEDEIASSDDVVIAALPEARSVASSSHYGENYYTADVMWGINGIKTEAFDNGYKGQNVGIHFPDVGCAKASYLNSSYYQELSCPNKNYAHATGVARILHSTAENAKLYGSDVKTATSANWLPSNPKSYSPQIMVGSNSYAFFTQWDSTKSHYVNTNDYTYYDYLMDDYIYNTHVTEFVAAGNYESDYMAGYYVTTPSKSVNSIAVGAVHPSLTGYTTNSGERRRGYEYKWYSLHLDPKLGNAKPEIANYTNFYFPGETPFVDPENHQWDGYMNGTSSSTPLSAAMAAVVMSQRSELKWHPEKVKAMFLAAGSIVPVNWDDFDYDNPHYSAHIPMYSKFIYSKNHVTGWASMTTNQMFGSGNTITLTENNIVKGKRYRVAIAWLSPADYVYANRNQSYYNLPQDIDLSVRVNGTWVDQSNSSDNPFEVIDFVAAQDGQATITIHLYRNSTPDAEISLGYSFVRVNQQ
jgi:hypothetical protein